MRSDKSPAVKLRIASIDSHESSLMYARPFVTVSVTVIALFAVEGTALAGGNYAVTCGRTLAGAQQTIPSSFFPSGTIRTLAGGSVHVVTIRSDGASRAPTYNEIRPRECACFSAASESHSTDRGRRPLTHRACDQRAVGAWGSEGRGQSNPSASSSARPTSPRATMDRLRSAPSRPHAKRSSTAVVP
jgi:hypothetical protein